MQERLINAASSLQLKKEFLEEKRKDESGINMLDLIVILTIMALLMAAAVSGIQHIQEVKAQEGVSVVGADGEIVSSESESLATTTSGIPWDTIMAFGAGAIALALVSWGGYVLYQRLVKSLEKKESQAKLNLAKS